MTPEDAIELMRQALWMLLLVSAPLLLSALFVGLLVGMFQAATQINEMTLSFIPKIVVVFLMLLVAGPWLLQSMIDFSRRLFMEIPGWIG
ncbi:MAG: flagellar export apparatus protein FliQ [Gammaproteobacteria bacterium]|nr:MAG: flagellar export apparatus protein FliQ [Gammaproteobacteria bacterium]